MVNYKVKNSHFLWRCSFQNEVMCRCSEYEHRTPILQATVVSRKRVYDATLQGAEKAQNSDELGHEVGANVVVVECLQGPGSAEHINIESHNDDRRDPLEFGDAVFGLFILHIYPPVFA